MKRLQHPTMQPAPPGILPNTHTCMGLVSVAHHRCEVSISPSILPYLMAPTARLSICHVCITFCLLCLCCTLPVSALRSRHRHRDTADTASEHDTVLLLMGPEYGGHAHQQQGGSETESEVLRINSVPLYVHTGTYEYPSSSSMIVSAASVCEEPSRPHVCTFTPYIRETLRRQTILSSCLERQCVHFSFTPLPLPPPLHSPPRFSCSPRNRRRRLRVERGRPPYTDR